jgi:hypothetical protein
MLIAARIRTAKWKNNLPPFLKETQSGFLAVKCVELRGFPILKFSGS